jgi:hypothetical protein
MHRILEFLNMDEGSVDEWSICFMGKLPCIFIFNLGPLFYAQ